MHLNNTSNPHPSIPSKIEVSDSSASVKLLYCGSQSIPLPKYIELRRQHLICQKVSGSVLGVIVCGVNEALTCQP